MSDCSSSATEDRAYDADFAFRRFIDVHGRPPSDAMLFNDVLHRIKTSDEILDPLRVFTTDKEFVKLYIKAQVGDAYNVPTLAVLRSEADVDAYDFPLNSCVKSTHMFNTVQFCDADSAVDKAIVKSWLGRNFYLISREANYARLRPKIIVEPILFGSKNLNDYKIFCYKGDPRLIMVDVNRWTKHERIFFDLDWNELDILLQFTRFEGPVERPERLAEMVEAARRLSAPFDFVRIDFYASGGGLFAGEITHCHGAGFSKFFAPEYERRMSSILFGG
jgi:TupA-like ATPgrasp